MGQDEALEGQVCEGEDYDQRLRDLQQGARRASRAMLVDNPAAVLVPQAIHGGVAKQAVEAIFHETPPMGCPAFVEEMQERTEVTHHFRFVPMVRSGVVVDLKRHPFTRIHPTAGGVVRRMCDLAQNVLCKGFWPEHVWAVSRRKVKGGAERRSRWMERH